MNNSERRVALAKARTKAMEYAEATEKFPLVDINGTASMNDRIQRREHIMKQSMMWSAVAEAMKIGDIDADAVIPEPASHFASPYTSTR